MSTCTTAPVTAADRMREARQLYDLGFPAAAAATSRSAIEIGIIERLGDELAEYCRRPIKERIKLLKAHTSLSSSKGDRVKNLFFALSGYVHGRNANCDGVPGLLDSADYVLDLLANC